MQRRGLYRAGFAMLLLLAWVGCGGSQTAYRGQASWYGGSYHGRKTASGQRFDKRAMTAAHRTLPFGTVVRVKNLKNGREVVVRINDRGPFGKRSRIIDLSEAAAERLGILHSGVAPVALEIVELPR